MLKKILLPFVLSFSLCQIAHAKVVELDNLNPNHCRQQLITGLDAAPTVMIYMKGCPWANKVRPLYEDISNAIPKRNLFAFNFFDGEHVELSSSYMRTAMECLGTTPFISPIFVQYNVFATPLPEKYYGYINGIQKMGLDGDATKEDILKFIGEMPNQIKQNVTFIPKQK